MRDEKRILVVDDDDAIRALVVTVLRRRGYRLDAARNGVDAVERLGTCQYSLIVLDLMMPRMSGYDVLDHLAGVPAVNRPLVLVLTAGMEPRSFDTTHATTQLAGPSLGGLFVQLVGAVPTLLVDTVSGCLSALVAQPQQPGCPPSVEGLERTN